MKADRLSPLDVNLASHKELVNLPGVDAAMADRIISTQPFYSLEVAPKKILLGYPSRNPKLIVKKLLIEEDHMIQEPESNDVVEEEPSQVEVPEEEEILMTTAASPESRSQQLLKLSIRWVIGVLIVFALGIMSAVLLLYIPERDGKSQLETELLQAESRIDTLESAIIQLENEIQGYLDREDALVSEAETMQEELMTANLHILILSALADVNAARVALANDDIAGARVHLTNTNTTLETLKELVGTEQRDKVIAMQNRLALVMAEINDNPSIAQSDLEVLANNLTLLENTFFAKP